MKTLSTRRFPLPVIGYGPNSTFIAVIESSEMHCDRWVPQQYRARALSLVYAAFSLGMVAGLICFPAFAAPFGWPTALVAFAAVGIGWGVRNHHAARLTVRKVMLHLSKNTADIGTSADLLTSWRVRCMGH